MSESWAGAASVSALSVRPPPLPGKRACRDVVPGVSYEDSWCSRGPTAPETGGDQQLPSCRPSQEEALSTVWGRCSVWEVSG